MKYNKRIYLNVPIVLHDKYLCSLSKSFKKRYSALLVQPILSYLLIEMDSIIEL